MPALREVVAQFDVRVGGANQLDQVDKKLERAKNSANKAIFSFGKLGAALAGAFAVRGIAHFFRQQADYGLQLESNAALTGLSVQQLQKWQYAATQAGESVEAITNGLHHFNHAIGMATQPQGKTYAEVMQAMGLQTHDTNGKMKDTNELLLEFADALHKTKDPQTRMGYAMQLAGRGGKVFVDILAQGREKTEEFLKQADEAGIVLGRDFTLNAKKAEQQAIKLDWSWKALKGTVAEQLFPWMKKLVDWATKFVKGFIDVVKHTTFAKTAFIALGAAIAIANFELVAIALAIGIAYLAFDDLYNLLSGNKSLIGDTIDEMSGAGTAKDSVDNLKDAWNDLTDAIFGTSSAAGQGMTVWGTMKATIGQLALIVGAAVASMLAEIAQLVGGVKAAYYHLTGDKDAEQKEQEAVYRAQGAAAKAHKNLGDFLTLANVKSANEMSLEDWRKLNGLQNVDINGNPINRHRKALSVSTIVLNEKGQRVETVQAGHKTTTHVVNNIHVYGGDPKAVQAAVHKGTSDALSQNDLRHAYHASRSTAPAVQ